MRNKIAIGFLLIIVGLMHSGCSTPKRTTDPLSTNTNGQRPPKPVASIEDPSRLPGDVLSRVKDAMVLIGDFENGNLTATGSGFAVGDGKRIVTNKHVVTGTDDKPDALKLVFWSGTDKARIVQVKPSAIKLYGALGRNDKDYHKEDLAFITIGAKVTEPLELDPDAELQETMPVWAFGFPHGISILSDQDMPSVTVHSLRLERIEKAKNVVTLLQVSGSPTYGNSGGPLIDLGGHVLGVIQAKTVDAPIIFAIPAVRVDKMLAGKQAPSQSIAALFKEPIDGVSKEKSSPQTSENDSDIGPRQSYASVLNQRHLSSSDLEGLTAFQLTLLRNEPFARRGYIFKRADLRRVFNATSWYSPRTRNLNAVQRLLTRTEIQNIDFIKAYQSSSGLEG